MNYIKFISLVFLMLFSLESNAQISSIGKATAKTGIKAGVKAAAKNSIKETAEKAVLKEIKEKAIKKGVKSAITEKLEHEITSSTINEISQKAFVESTDNIIKKSTKISGEKIVKRKTQQLARGKVSYSSKRYLNHKISNYVVGATKTASEITEFGVKKNTNKAIVEETATNILSLEAKNIQKAIGKTGYEQVAHYLPEISSQRILLNDIQKNPQLAKYFKKNPTLIQNYSQCLDSHLRTDISTLRYLNYHADSYADACMFSKTKYLRAKDLKFVDRKSQTLILSNQTGETLGIIEENILRIPTNNHSLLNMRLMKNMTYQVDNSIFQTDKLGRPVYAKTIIDSKFKGTTIYERDKKAQADFRKARTNASKLDSEKLNDDAGHIIAHDLGGVSDGINLLPQNASLNRGAYKKMENKIKKDVKKGHKAEIEIKIHYTGASERPTNYVYSYYKNGNLDAKKTFDNPK